MIVIKIIIWIILTPILLIIGILTYNHAYIQWSNTEWYEAITIEVETPSGVKTGRSVALVGYQFNSPIFDGGAGGAERGEAVVVEVLPGQYLFALMRSEKTTRKYLQQEVFPEINRERDEKKLSDKEWVERFRDMRGSRAIPRDAMPVMVRFRDIKDPASVERVEPYDLAASFGPGVKLKSIRLEMLGPHGTVTRGEVVKVLPCLKSGKACVPLNETLPYGHPMGNILNEDFTTGVR